MAQLVKRLPTMWETQVQSLVWEDPLEKEMATHSSILAWKIPYPVDVQQPRSAPPVCQALGWAPRHRREKRKTRSLPNRG